MKKSREEKRKAIIDDGCSPELVAGAKFDGILEIPVIEKPRQILLPAGITPFTAMEKQTNRNEAIGFYEMDGNFADILINPEKYLSQLADFTAMISPDCSLYRNAHHAVTTNHFPVKVFTDDILMLVLRTAFQKQLRKSRNEHTCYDNYVIHLFMLSRTKRFYPLSDLRR